MGKRLDKLLTESHQRFHGRPKPAVPKSQYRTISGRLHPALFAEAQRLAVAQQQTVTDWITEAVVEKLERERRKS